MIETITGALEASAWAVALRHSTWVYPLVNAAHILGMALLVGAIVSLDLRLAGLWKTVAVDGLKRVLMPVALAGFGLAVISGSLLFITRATEYITSAWFLGKMGVIVLAGLNALWLLRSRRHSGRVGRIPALASIALWVSALVLGRLVGYF